MRIKIEGSITTERILQVLNDITARYGEESCFTGMNLYFTLRNANGTPVDFLGEEGQVLECITYREERKQTPLRSKKPRRRKPQLSIVKSESSAA